MLFKSEANMLRFPYPVGITGVEDGTEDDAGTGVEVRNMSSNSMASLQSHPLKFELFLGRINALSCC